MNGCQNCILRLQRNDSRKNWCWGKKVTVFITFEIYSKYVRRFCEKVRHGCQNCISRLQMIIPRKKNKSLEYPIILTFLRNRASNSRSLVRKLQARLSKLLSTCTKDQFEKKFDVGEKCLLFLSLLNFNQNMFGFLRKSFCTVVKTAFHVNGWSFRERRINLSNKT